MKPLSKKIRFFLVSFLAIIFIILAPIILAKSFGYHFNRIQDVLTLVKTGGIYVISNLSGVEVYVDNEYFKDSGLFLKNIKIQDLNPNREYQIVAQKIGYHDWRKTLPVYESLMTESRLLMLPIEIDKIETYPFSDLKGVGTTTPPENSKENTVLPEQALVGGYLPTNQEYRDLVNLFNNEDDLYSVKTSLVEENLILEEDLVSTSSTSTDEKKDIPDYFVELGVENPDDLENLIISSNQVAWLENGDILLNWVDENTPDYYYCIEKEKCRKQIIIDWQNDILKFDFFPGRGDVFIVLNSEGLYAVEIDDRSERNIQPLYLGEKLDFQKNNQNQLIIKDGLIFYQLDL